MTARASSLAALAVLLMLAACREERTREFRSPRSCAGTGTILADTLATHPAVAALPRDVRRSLIEALQAPGQICLTAPTLSVGCNTGDARAPDIRRCCRFARPPEVDLTGVPRRIRIGRKGGPGQEAAVDLRLRGILDALALDQRCEAPTCQAEVAAGRPQIELGGKISADDTSVAIDLRVDLGTRLDLTCELPRQAANEQ